VLAQSGYSRLDQFTKVSEADLSRLHGMRPKALDRIRDALANTGSSFGGAKAAAKNKNGKTKITGADVG
jgi:hypothetical protein